MGEKSAPVPKVICVRLRSWKLYFQMFVTPFTSRLRSMEFPGSAHAMSLPGISPKSTASWLVNLILKIRTFGESHLQAPASKLLPPGNRRRGEKTKLLS
jgi:hypothetical protein